MFNIGDKVECVRGDWYKDTEGLVGIIVTNNERYGFGIDYGLNEDGRPHNHFFHNLDGKIKTNTGYWIWGKDLEIVKTKKKSNKYNYIGGF